MEFCSGGSCSDLLKAGTIPEEYIMIIVRELLMGLEYLHADNKLHRDVKGQSFPIPWCHCPTLTSSAAANILLGANGQVKLADFGVSGQLSATVTKKNTFVGTPYWMAPEVIKQSGHNHKADIWSLGITAIELACGDPPNIDLHPMKVLFLIPKNPPPTLEGPFSQAFKDFVGYCLRRDPRERPTARDLLRHPFLRKAKKPTYLTELIERYERWSARHGKPESQAQEDLDRYQPPQHDPDAEDLWDFGTIKPINGRTPGLKAMNEAGANARNLPKELAASDPREKRQTDSNLDMENSSQPVPNAVRAASPEPEMSKFSTATTSFSPPSSPIGPSTPSPMKANAQSRKPVANAPAETPGKPGNVLQATPSRQMTALSLNTTPSDTPVNMQTPSTGQPGKGPMTREFASGNVGIRNELPKTPAPAQQNVVTANGAKQPQAQPAMQFADSSGGSWSSSGGSETASSSSSTSRSETEQQAMTALGGVVLPALQAAVHRRAYNLSMLHQKLNKLDGGRANSETMDKRRKQIEAQDSIKTLANKAGRLFSDIDQWDKWAPVGMGDEVGSFLEGLLEEILVRVEAED